MRGSSSGSRSAPSNSSRPCRTLDGTQKDFGGRTMTTDVWGHKGGRGWHRGAENRKEGEKGGMGTGTSNPYCRYDRTPLRGM